MLSQVLLLIIDRRMVGPGLSIYGRRSDAAVAPSSANHKLPLAEVPPVGDTFLPGPFPLVLG